VGQATAQGGIKGDDLKIPAQQVTDAYYQLFQIENHSGWQNESLKKAALSASMRAASESPREEEAAANYADVRAA